MIDNSTPPDGIASPSATSFLKFIRRPDSDGQPRRSYLELNQFLVWAEHTCGAAGHLVAVRVVGELIDAMRFEMDIRPPTRWPDDDQVDGGFRHG